MDVQKDIPHRQQHGRFPAQGNPRRAAIIGRGDVSVELDIQQRQIVISPVEKAVATGIDETSA